MTDDDGDFNSDYSDVEMISTLPPRTPSEDVNASIKCVISKLPETYDKLVMSPPNEHIAGLNTETAVPAIVDGQLINNHDISGTKIGTDASGHISGDSRWGGDDGGNKDEGKGEDEDDDDESDDFFFDLNESGASEDDNEVSGLSSHLQTSGIDEMGLAVEDNIVDQDRPEEGNGIDMDMAEVVEEDAQLHQGRPRRRTRSHSLSSPDEESAVTTPDRMVRQHDVRPSKANSAARSARRSPRDGDLTRGSPTRGSFDADEGVGKRRAKSGNIERETGFVTGRGGLRGSRGSQKPSNENVILAARSIDGTEEPVRERDRGKSGTEDGRARSVGGGRRRPGSSGATEMDEIPGQRKLTRKRRMSHSSNSPTQMENEPIDLQTTSQRDRLREGLRSSRNVPTSTAPYSTTPKAKFYRAEHTAAEKTTASDGGRIVNRPSVNVSEGPPRAKSQRKSYDRVVGSDSTSSSPRKNWVSYEESRRMLQSLGIRSKEDFLKMAGEDSLPPNIPKRPMRVYRDKGWQSYENYFDFSDLEGETLLDGDRHTEAKSSPNYGSGEPSAGSILSTVPQKRRRNDRSLGRTAATISVSTAPSNALHCARPQLQPSTKLSVEYAKMKRQFHELGIRTREDYLQKARGRSKAYSWPDRPWLVFRPLFGTETRWSWDRFLDVANAHLKVRDKDPADEGEGDDETNSNDEVSGHFEVIATKNANRDLQIGDGRAEGRPSQEIVPCRRGEINLDAPTLSSGLPLCGCGDKAKGRHTVTTFELARELVRELALRSRNEYFKEQENDEKIKGFLLKYCIPKDPELTYSRQNTWTSWDDFLCERDCQSEVASPGELPAAIDHKNPRDVERQGCRQENEIRDTGRTFVTEDDGRADLDAENDDSYQYSSNIKRNEIWKDPEGATDILEEGKGDGKSLNIACNDPSGDHGARHNSTRITVVGSQSNNNVVDEGASCINDVAAKSNGHCRDMAKGSENESILDDYPVNVEASNRDYEDNNGERNVQGCSSSDLVEGDMTTDFTGTRSDHANAILVSSADRNANLPKCEMGSMKGDDRRCDSGSCIDDSSANDGANVVQRVLSETTDTSQRMLSGKASRLLLLALQKRAEARLRGEAAGSISNSFIDRGGINMSDENLRTLVHDKLHASSSPSVIQKVAEQIRRLYSHIKNDKLSPALLDSLEDLVLPLHEGCLLWQEGDRFAVEMLWTIALYVDPDRVLGYKNELDGNFSVNLAEVARRINRSDVVDHILEMGVWES